MYHHIDDKPGWLYVKKDIFVQQMAYLSKNGYTIVGLEEIVQGLRGEKTLPAKPIALTFDDGYRDFFNNAYPILRQKGFRAAVFLISQLMDGADFLTWEQAREMAGSGLIALGDHTMTHRALASLKEETIPSCAQLPYRLSRIRVGNAGLQNYGL